MCNRAGITPIVTTASEATLAGSPGASKSIGPELPTVCCNASDMADFVEYCWGGEDTVWGKQRIRDGHPSVYNVSYFELGNEQKNSRFIDQVIAMEKRASDIGIKDFLYYIWPDTKYIGDDLNISELARANALNLGKRLVMDVHT
eukprot:UC4_evm1s504